MRRFAPVLLVLAVACQAPRQAPRASVDPSTTPSPPTCQFGVRDSIWLDAAIRGWREVGEPRLLLAAGQALPSLILFDPACVYHIDVAGTWRIRSAAHGGRVQLPDGRVIAPVGIGFTSPTLRDSAIFLALALPEAWRADPRYRGTDDSRLAWERYLVAAFTHEMTHARMLPGLVPRLRAAQASIYPDTLEDNLVQGRFGGDREFARAIARETELLYLAAQPAPVRVQRGYARAALATMQDRRDRFYRGPYAGWEEVEQIFLDLEGVAQWAAFGHTAGALRRGPEFDRALARFRENREFWSEDEGLGLILALDALVPNWQPRLIGASPASSIALLRQALGDER